MVSRLATAQSTVAIWHWRPAAIVTLATVAELTALIADALATQARLAPPSEATAPRAAVEPIMPIVSIKTQQVTLYDADGLDSACTGIDRRHGARDARWRLRR